MKKFIVIGCVGLCLAACTSTERGAESVLPPVPSWAAWQRVTFAVPRLVRPWAACPVP